MWRLRTKEEVREISWRGRHGDQSEKRKVKIVWPPEGLEDAQEVEGSVRSGAQDHGRQDVESEGSGKGGMMEVWSFKELRAEKEEDMKK